MCVSIGMKRTIDIILSALSLVLFAPLFAVCCVAILLEDGRPVIFSQERMGRHGRPFRIYKFRSMMKGAEADGPSLCLPESDARLTRVGRFLRDHHLDELPQLWNVFIGDMAFVGPRPERKYYIDRIMERDPRYEQLYRIRPGVTSYATLYNGYTDTMEKMLTRLHMDIAYLKKRTLWTDVTIIFKTFASIVSGRKF